MKDQWYAEESSYATADLFCGGEPAEALVGSASPPCLGGQIRELLGEDFELEASFLEESWMSGRPMTSATCERKRDRAARNYDSFTFAELNALGSFFFSPANEWLGDRPAYACHAGSADSYRAAWLRDPPEERVSRVEEHTAVQDSTGYKEPATEPSTFASMTYQRACELLSVSGDSTVPQIRREYRRMVSEWHPDRLEQSGERMRAFATKQMVAINEAYRLLRGLSPARAC